MTSTHSDYRVTAGPPAAPARGRDLGNVALRVIVAVGGLAMVLAHIAGISGPLPVILVGIPFAIVAAGRRYGWGLMGIYFGVTLVVSIFFENLSITTGFPFGHYHYPTSQAVLVPRIGNFPIVVALAYTALGMVCWFVATTLLDGADRRLADRTDPARRVNIVAMPVVSAVLMTMFDLGNDSIASTVSHSWVWEHGGGIFGVPWTNYMGWFFVTYIFFQIFALILASRKGKPSGQAAQPARREPLVQAVLMYTFLAGTTVLSFIGSHTGTKTDLAGQVWDTHAIYETLFTINVFGTLVMVALATIKLLRNDIARADSITAPAVDELRTPAS